jgi:hypothetical protein
MMWAEYETKNCEVCGNGQLRSVLDLGLHPMCDDLVSVGDSRICKEYPIEILYCDVCRTACQRFQIPKLDLFPPTYHYRSRHTADVLDGMRMLVSACAETLGSLRDVKVLDVGCNDGSLLSIFRESGADTFGIEPTDAASDALAAGHRVMNAFIDEDVATQFCAKFGRPDIVTFTNVFAHIEDLPAVLRSLRILAHEKTLIVIENHYLGSILDGRQFDTFYHEHPRTYSYTSFVHIAETLEMRIAKVEFPARYGGNIRVFFLPKGNVDLEESDDRREVLDARESAYGRRLEQLPKQIDHWRTKKNNEIATAVGRYGALDGKAFPGRSAIPIKLLDLGKDDVSAIYEKPASGKIGYYVPGSRIPIKSDNDFKPHSDARPLINMAWHISSEIRAYMEARGYRGPIIDIIAPSDFEE